MSRFKSAINSADPAASFFKDISWEEDFRERINPELMTRLMHQCVPALKASGWQITVVESGYAETILPLNQATTNQHGTHQAALISLSADYTGGMAVTSLLRGVPLAGIHKCSTEDAASLWLVSMNVRYKAPSTGHLIGRCRIPERERDLIVSRYNQGNRVLVTLPMEFESNGQIVAEAELTYFAQPAKQLLEPGKKSSTLFNQKIKASARMIAGVRARASFSSNGRTYRVDPSHAQLAAGPQGEMLAEKLNRALPQLVQMVEARTQHGDQMLRSVRGLKQVVLAGAGLDMRPFQMQHEFPDVVFYEVDLPEMIAERTRIAKMLPDHDSQSRVMIAADFLEGNFNDKLLGNGFVPSLPTAIIFEGCSMYFDSAVNCRLLKSFAEMMDNPDSRLWVDFVSESVINGETVIPEVQAFFERMDEMGESFIFGTNHPEAVLESCNLDLVSTTSVQEFMDQQGVDSDDPVLDQYSFSVSRRK
ncbi:MAG: class I SAM-dependent methyltransferase [Pirellulaceae bacterium]